MSVFQISEYRNYNDVFLDIIIMEMEGSEDSAFLLAQNLNCKIILFEDRLEIQHFNGEVITLKDKNRDKYQFQICTKLSGYPISLETIQKMSSKEIQDLLQNENYMTTADDYENIHWTLSEAYGILHTFYPEKNHFSFDSLAYGVKEKG